MSIFLRNITLFHQDCTPTFENEEPNRHNALMSGNYSHVLRDIYRIDPDFIVIMNNFYDDLNVYRALQERNYKIVIIELNRNE